MEGIDPATALRRLSQALSDLAEEAKARPDNAHRRPGDAQHTAEQLRNALLELLSRPAPRARF